MNDGNLKVWDIEDLVKSLTDIRLDVCPYFLTTREFTKDANIIFCPFNYLIDPIIRENSDVYLENSIIILDEAHNIEDICRSAASFEFTDVEIDHSIRNLKSRIEELSKHTGLRQITSFLQNNADSSNKREQLELYCEALSKWHDYLVAFYANFAEQVKKVEKLQADKYSKTKTMNLNWNQLENFFDDEIDLARNPSKEFLVCLFLSTK
jgi:Rad3-related DNA helicase